MSILEIIQSSCLVNCVKEGLKAFSRTYKKHISIKQNTKIIASVEIDECMKSQEPTGNRWDYLVIYDNGEERIIFIEIHSAYTNEVRTMLNKLAWLKDLINSKIPAINQYQPKFYWIASDKIKIPNHTPQYKKLRKMNLVPIKIITF